MGDIALRFSQPLGPQPGGAVVLRFGAVGSAPVGPVSAVARVRSAWRCREAAAAQPVRAVWSPTQPSSGHVRISYGPAHPIERSTRASWHAAGQHLAALSRAPWRPTVAVGPAWTRCGWSPTQPIGANFTASWRDAQAVLAAISAGWQDGQALTAVARAVWRGSVATVVAVAVPWDTGVAAAAVTRGAWRDAVGIASHGSAWVPVPPPPPPPAGCWEPEPGGMVTLRLVRARPAVGNAVWLLFGCRRPAIAVVPIRRVYMAINNTSLIRVIDGIPVPALGMTLSLDVDSWCWGFSASVLASALDLVMPGEDGVPIELQANVNGTPIRVIAESISRERVFEGDALRVQGRGKTAVLDAPFSPVTEFGNWSGALTSQQLVDQALPSGWTADWGLVPWLVPAGVWSHQGTPISAAIAVATAGGGYLQPHGAANVLRVLPRYPVAPWNWSTVTPDLQLPAELTTRESISWTRKASYNRVYVSGTVAGGKLVRVTREGTAGDLVAPMITDALTTHGDAGRQRGLPVLAGGGHQASVSLRLPVLAETGIILPGTLVRYVDGAQVRIGLSRSVSVDDGEIETWQTIGVETHEF